jgi:hypothetical protein
VLMSVLSMLAEPNIESGANIEVSPSGSFIKLVDIRTELLAVRVPAVLQDVQR